ALAWGALAPRGRGGARLRASGAPAAARSLAALCRLRGLRGLWRLVGLLFVRHCAHALSMISPDLRATRTFLPSPSARMPIRVGLLLVGSTSITLDRRTAPPR